MQNPKFYTVESVTSGHPDKICDQISDAILDECLRQDPLSRVAMETFGAHGLLVIGGELTTKAKIDAEKIALDVYREIRYSEKLEIKTNIVKQSPDIAMGVNDGGAGDQGIMYGYATKETKEKMPKGVILVHKLTKKLEELRKNGEIKWLKPDGKSQITIKNDEIATVLISTQHDEVISLKEIKRTLVEKIVKPTIGEIKNINVLINPTGRFVKGGFEADTGLTGRKIMVDTYGGIIPHGGGCFSGKDPSKVDRSAAYMARYVAQNLVNAQLAKKCMVSLAYAIGQAEPVMVSAVDEKGKDLSEIAKNNFQFAPADIIKELDLRKPIYRKTASYGHFGKKDLPWEKIKEIKKS